MPTADQNLRVFLCHASQDKISVRELFQRLRKENWIDPWLDEEMLLPGQDWNLEIMKALESADAVIVCLSNQSVSKEGYVQKELRSVLDIALEKPEGTIYLIPLRLDDCELPRRLREWQYLDYFSGSNREMNYQRLLESLKSRASAFDVLKPQPTSDAESCSNCSSPFRKTEDIVRCKNCGAYYHKECWDYLLGRCRISNCGSQNYVNVSW